MGFASAINKSILAIRADYPLSATGSGGSRELPRTGLDGSIAQWRSFPAV